MEWAVNTSTFNHARICALVDVSHLRHESPPAAWQSDVEVVTNSCVTVDLHNRVVFTGSRKGKHTQFRKKL